MENNEFKTVRIKNRACYYFDNIIRYLTSLKSGITYMSSHYFAKTKINSYDSLLIEKTLTLHNIIILIKLALNKDQNHFYYETFLENFSNQLAKK